MGHTYDSIRHDDRNSKKNEAQQLLEDRTQLLDTIREMINEEIDHRGVGRGEVAQCSNPPPEPKPRRCSLLHWLRSLL